MKKEVKTRDSKKEGKDFLTPLGRALVEKSKEERKKNIERNNGQYIPEPWYRCYLSSTFKINNKV